MSSFEANTYTVKPTAVQVGNSISVAKPIIASNLLIKPQTEQRAPLPVVQQQKRIQPLSKPARDQQLAGKLKTNPGTSTAVLQLKNLQKAPVGAVHEDSQRGEPPRKQPALESVTIRKANKEIPTLKAAIPAQKKILTVTSGKPADSIMGNDQQRMPAPAAGNSTPATIAETANSSVTTQQLLSNQAAAAAAAQLNIPVPVATLNAGQGLAPRMASIINASGDVRLVTNTPPPANPALAAGPRVMATPNSKTIAASGGAVKQHITHRPASLPSIGARTAVIQSAPSSRLPHQQPIIRSVTPPVRPAVHSQYRNQVNLGHQAQNPTTVQITIHQPRNTVTNAPANNDRLITNTHFSAGLHGNQVTHPGHAVTATTVSIGSGQSTLPRLVISQSKSTVPYPESRIIAANPPYKKAVRSAAPSGQHDYIRSDQLHAAHIKKSYPDVGSMPSRLGMSLHSMADSKANFIPTVTSTAITPSSKFHPTTLNHMDEPPGKFKTHNFSMPAIISSSSTSKTNLTGPSPGGDNSHDMNPYGINMPRAGPSPSILRKRPHDSNNAAVVVKKISQPADRLSASDKPLLSQPATQYLSCNTLVDKDTGSQSSTDTAMSSESPNQSGVKHEPPEAVENGEAEVQPSPRKKPRKQLLNTAAELKDRHDSSTEEETETKTARPASPIADACKMEFEKDFKLTEADGFLDRSGVRWVKMRERNPASLMNSLPYSKHWNPRYNHFQRSSDFKLKEERRPVVSELSNQKGIQQKINGWKFYHLSSQFQELIETEQVLCDRMGKLAKCLPSKPKDKHPELFKLYELAQANKQRCSLTKDQLWDAKQSLFKILDTHKPKVSEIVQKNHSKRPVKKKER